MVIGYELYPATLYLNITNQCSNDCTFCVRRRPGFALGGFSLRLQREPSAAEVLADVAAQRAARGRPFAEVVFCGFGEPTCRLDLVLAVGRELRARGERVRLNTNGHAALLNNTDGFPALGSALDAVSISLNAPDEAGYLALCQPRFGAQAYGALIHFARRAVACVPDVTLTAVSAALDDAALERCAELATALGAGFRAR